jgi:hypothetical protein
VSIIKTRTTLMLLQAELLMPNCLASTEQKAENIAFVRGLDC